MRVPGGGARPITGRRARPHRSEARIEKRKEAGARIHGAAKAAEEGMAGMDMGDDVLMGSTGRSDFHKACVGDAHACTLVGRGGSALLACAQRGC